MRTPLVAIFCFFGTQLSAQISKSEHYAIAQFAICSGTEQQSYSWQQNGTTNNMALDLGSATSIEAGLGFRLIDSFFSEATVGFYVKNSISSISDNGVSYDQGYKFTRYAFNLNGAYFLPITDNMNLNFKAGFSYYLPQDLTIYSNQQTDVIKYTANAAPFVGFGVNLEKKWLVTQLGLRYKYEKHDVIIDPDRKTPLDNSLISPTLNSIDICISVIFLF